MLARLECARAHLSTLSLRRHESTQVSMIPKELCSLEYLRCYHFVVTKVLK